MRDNLHVNDCACRADNTAQKDTGPQLKQKREMRYRLSPVVNGTRVYGKIMLPAHASPASNVPGAVLCHGFGGNHDVMEASASLLVDKGIAAIIFDMHGHGTSEGLFSGNMDQQVIDAWRLLKSLPEVDNSRIALIGHSLGALASVMAAGKVKPKALVALSCPYEVQQRLLNNPCFRAFPWYRWAVTLIGRLAVRFRKLKVKVDWEKFLQFWSQVKLSPALAELGGCNKLFVFSDSDVLVPYREFSRFYENAPGPKQKMVVRGGVHTTPIRAEILRFEWIGWVISALSA